MQSKSTSMQSARAQFKQQPAFSPALPMFLSPHVRVQPEGDGKYEWSDGSGYEGGWKVCAAAAGLYWVVNTAWYTTCTCPTAVER
jgi:hypothetical protein